MSMIQFLIKSNYSVPRFCYHSLLSVAGNCRVCVIDDKEIKTSVSCALCYESYEIEAFNNNSIIGIYVKNAIYIREYIFEFLLLSHPLDCPICDRGGECELQDMTNSFGADRSRYSDNKSVIADKLFNTAISTHMSRCITCGRCVRFLREISSCYYLGIVGRGNLSEISSYVDIVAENILYASNIIDLCPVCILVVSGLDKKFNFLICLVLLVGVNFEHLFFYIHVLHVLSHISSSYTNLISFCTSTTGAYVAYSIYFSEFCKKYIYRVYYSLPVSYQSRKLLDDVYECVLCASCSASCPSYWWNSGMYLGPAVLLQAYRWIVDSNDSQFYKRLNILDINYNISLCHGIGNCKIVCPKNLDPAGKISDLKSILGFNNMELYYFA